MELFSRMVERYTPPMNQKVMNGYATHMLKELESYMDAQIRSICVGLVKSVKYIGYERCSPDEEYYETTRLRNNKRFFNIAHTSIYMVKYFFEYTNELGQSEILSKPIYLPYVKDGGLMNIGGTEMHLVPVLSDKIFTVSNDIVFVRLIQDRNNFYRMYHTVIIDDKWESRHISHAEIYRTASQSRSSRRSRPSTKAKTCLAHYLFARYGFEGVFSRYLGFVPIVGTIQSITTKNYPKDQWVIVRSTKLKPKSNLERFYNATDLAVAVPRSKWTRQVETLLVGLFYVIDHFPERFGTDHRALEDTSLWMILIGHIRFTDILEENKLYTNIKEHFETIEPYLDRAVKVKLLELGLALDNYFDLLYYIQAEFNTLIRTHETNGLCVYGKNFEILQNVAYDILYGFTMMKFKLNKIAVRSAIRQKDVEDALCRVVRTGAIFKLNDGKLVCNVVASTTDHKYPKITSVVAEQESGVGGQRESSEQLIPTSKNWLHLSMVTTGSIMNVPKSNPTPVVRVNPWIMLDDRTGTVLENPKFKELIEANRNHFRSSNI